MAKIRPPAWLGPSVDKMGAVFDKAAGDSLFERSEFERQGVAKTKPPAGLDL